MRTRESPTLHHAQISDSENAPGPRQAPSTRSDLLVFMGIVALAFTVRLIYLHQSRSVVFFDHLISDARAYDEWAQRIAAGDWLDKTQGVFYQAPLYPYFLAMMHTLFGRDLWWIRFVQIVLGSLSCGLMFLAGRALFSRRTGIVVGLLLALYSPAIFLDGLIQKESIGQLWITLLLCVLACVQHRPTSWRWVAAGFVLGLLTLVRENTVLFVAVLLTWLAIHFADRSRLVRLRWSVAFVAGLGGVLLPVGIRNWAVGGQFALTTAQAGPNFFIGNNPQADGSYSPLVPGRGDTPYERHDATVLAEAALGHKLTPREVSRYWFGRAWDFVRSEPLAWSRLMAVKSLLVVHTYEIPDAEDMYFYETHCSVLRVLGVVGRFGVLCPLAAAGVVLTWARRRQLWLLYALLAAIAAGLVAFYVMARYRFPMVPILLLFAAAALVEGAAALRARRFLRVGVASTALLAVAVMVNWPMHDTKKGGANAYANAGSALAEQGKLEQAVQQYRIAIRLDPSLAKGHFYLGKALALTGQLSEGIHELRMASRLAPEDPRILGGLAAALLQSGDLTAAADSYRQVLVVRPSDAEAHNSLGTVYLRAERWSLALETFRRGLQYAPDHVALGANLAWVLAACPDLSLRNGSAAVALAERVCRNTGNEDPKALGILAAAYMEVYRFDDAVAAARRGLRIAERLENEELIRKLRNRLSLCESARP